MLKPGTEPVVFEPARERCLVTVFCVCRPTQRCFVARRERSRNESGRHLTKVRVWRKITRSEQVELPRLNQRLGSASDVELAVNLVQMPLGCALGDREPGGDIAVGQTIRDQS